jgi:hypothetical protein
MAVMLPLVSALNETPNSSGPLGPLSTFAGTIVLGQMVCWAAALAEQAKTIANPSRTAPAYLKNSVMDVLVAASRLATRL